jgi:hypothetical protein
VLSHFRILQSPYRDLYRCSELRGLPEPNQANSESSSVLARCVKAGDASLFLLKR